MAIQVPLSSAVSLISALKSDRWILIAYLRTAAENFLNYILFRLTDLRFISWAIGVSLLLLASLSGVEMVCLFTFRVAVAALEKFLRDAFWAAHLGISVVLFALMGCAVMVGLKGNGEVEGGRDGAGEGEKVCLERDGLLVEVRV